MPNKPRIQQLGQFQKKYSLGEEDYDALLTALDDTALVSVTDSKGDIVFANQAFVRVSKYPFEELIGQNHRILKSGEQSDELFDGLWATISAGKVWRGEIKNRAKDGTHYWVDTSIVPIFGTSGAIERYISVRFLITDKKYLELQRDSFIATATHELKTPITSIKAYTQVLQRRFQKAGELESAELLGKMDSQLNKLTKLVSAFLDVSKIETGKLEYQVAPFDLDKVIEEVVEELQRTTDHHQINVIGSIGKPIVGDEYRIGQVLTNLIDNAIKYSPDAAKIEVRIIKAPARVIVSVHDYGLGIPKADQKRIFQRFFRTQGAKLSPGFGLGLYISSEIIKNHHGEIWVDSQVKKGSTFSFALPWGRA